MKTELGRKLRALRDKIVASGARTMSETADEFLTRCSTQHGRIVRTGDLLREQIVEAQADGRMYVNDDGIGFVLLPWDLTTQLDRARERLFNLDELPRYKPHIDID